MHALPLMFHESAVKMKKIAIIGCGGSGKTTLALKLSKQLNLPLYHLDQYYWKPNWQIPIFEEFALIHHRLCQQEKWIIEGIYSRTLEYRFLAADCIIFLDIPQRICLWRVIKRAIKYFGIVRPSAAVGCSEKLDLEFLKWIWSFPKKSRRYILNLIEEYQDDKQIHVINSTKNEQKVINQILSNFNKNEGLYL